MREVIKELEETTEYRFFYNDGIKGLNSPISVDVEDADINAVMDAIAKQANVAYVLKSGHQIVLSSVKTVQQQGNKKVTGTITDPKGEPIIGANVVVKGSTNGTITDIDGHFSIEVTPNAILHAGRRETAFWIRISAPACGSFCPPTGTGAPRRGWNFISPSARWLRQRRES